MCTAPPVQVCIWPSMISSINQEGMCHWDLWPAWFAFWWGLLAFILPAVYRPLWMIGPIGGIWGQLRFDLWCCDRSLWGVYWSANLLLSFISAQCYWVLLKMPTYLKKKKCSTGKTGWPGVMNNRFFGSFMNSKFMFKGDLYLGCISDEAGIWDSCLNDPAGIDPTGHCLWHCLR